VKYLGKRGHPNPKEAFRPGPLESPPLERIGWGLQGSGLLPALLSGSVATEGER